MAAPSTTEAPGAAGRSPMVPVPHRVLARRHELADTVTFGIESLGEGLPQPRPGQFNMLWAFGVGEVPISVSGGGVGAAADEPVEHTVRAVGAVTRALCDLHDGDVVGVRGPFGRGWDLDAARGHDVMVVGGGIGLAPLRPVVEALVDRRDEFGRIAVLVGARSPQELLYRDLLSEWRGRLDIDVEVTVDHAHEGWHGDVGVVTHLISRIPVDAATATAFVCGPEIMMRFAANELLEQGVSPERIQVSMERNMVCAVAHCGHCQLGPTFVCREGPVYPYESVAGLMVVRGL